MEQETKPPTYQIIEHDFPEHVELNMYWIRFFERDGKAVEGATILQSMLIRKDCTGTEHHTHVGLANDLGIPHSKMQELSDVMYARAKDIISKFA